MAKENTIQPLPLIKEKRAEVGGGKCFCESCEIFKMTRECVEVEELRRKKRKRDDKLGTRASQSRGQAWVNTCSICC